MTPEEKILTYAQAKELKWFTKNCTGLRIEYYDLFDKFRAFKDKLDSLHQTCELIDRYFESHPAADVMTDSSPQSTKQKETP